ncbi:MAG: lipid II flippase MurJ, partial [Lentisphaeria bacterium]
MIKVHKNLAQKSIFTSAVIFFSRILGFFRDVVLASFWGTSIAMDAFVFAFKIPNLMRSLFGEGALTAGFIPLYAQIREENPQKATLLANNIITITTIFLSIITTLAIAISISLQPFFSSPTALLTLKLLPWFLPYIILICIIALLSGILNANHSFLIPAAMPCLLNLFFIFCAYFICPFFGNSSAEQIFGMTVAILGGGFIQIIILLIKLRKVNIIIKPVLKTLPETTIIFSKSWRAIIGSGVNQINAV